MYQCTMSHQRGLKVQHRIYLRKLFFKKKEDYWAFKELHGIYIVKIFSPLYYTPSFLHMHTHSEARQRPVYSGKCAGCSKSALPTGGGEAMSTEAINFQCHPGQSILTMSWTSPAKWLGILPDKVLTSKFISSVLPEILWTTVLIFFFQFLNQQKPSSVACS